MKPDTLTRAGWPSLAFSRFALHAVYSAFFITLFISPSYASAQQATSTGCGEIDYGYFSQPIADCSNPFGRTHTETGFLINGQPVVDGNTIVVPEAGVTSYGLIGENFFNPGLGSYYKHTETGYLALSVEFAYPERTEIEAKIAEYFNNDQNNIFTYTQIYDASYKYPFFNLNSEQRYFDAGLGRYVEDVYYEMEDYVQASVHSERTALLPGTYTFLRVDTDEEVIMVSKAVTPIKQLMDFLLPTAHAYSNVHTITFTLATSTPVVVTGPSSVLFLPGIMGSRLFEESGECNYINSDEKEERWFSTFDCDIERLMMNESGQSINNIFTEIDGGVIDEAVGQNLYKTFLADLAEWKEKEKIADYKAIPYDWRLRLQDILRVKSENGRTVLEEADNYQSGYLYQNLQTLKNSSPSGRVVLIGHSNGGLVIQALLATMKANNDPLLTAIDKVILVAVPQTGTPEAVLGLLHGVEIGFGGVAVSQERSRLLMNTAPFAYHLLPSEDYYSDVATPVIKIEAGTSTDAWRSQFGAELDSYDEVITFMRKESGRDMPENDDLLTPATTYNSLHQYANVTQVSMTNWRSSNTKVYQIAGTGILTPATITYFTNTECTQHSYGLFGLSCEKEESKLGYREEKVIDGDGTVVTPSALAIKDEGVEKWWIDLEEYDSFVNIGRVHKDIMEIDEISLITANIISSSTGTYNFLSKSEPDLGDEERIVYRLHSPLDLYVVLSDGEVVGSSTPYLRGVQYSRYGEVQSLSVPVDEEDYLVRLSGLAIGSFTFEMDEYTGNTLQERTSYIAIPSSTSTEVMFRVGDTDLLDDLSLEMDYEGDGVFETSVAPGLGQMTYVSPTNVATSSSQVVIKGSSSSSTKVKNRNLPEATLGVLASANVIVSQQELMLQLIKLLTQYRDLLIKLNVQ